MAVNELSWQIGGVAGDGIEVGGQILALAMARMGLDVFTFRSYPSRIRGGYTSYKVRVSENQVLSRGDDLDILVAFNQESIDHAMDELVAGGVIICDKSAFDARIPEVKPVNVYPAPILDIAEGAGSKVMRNVASLGITAELIGIPTEIVMGILRERFEQKGQEAIEANREALEGGRDFARDNIKRRDTYRVRQLDRKRYLIGGDEATGFGALAGGCRFMSAYPITPATYIMQWLAKEMPKHGGVMVQAEDEIAAAHMAIGAGYAGVRAMTATSGPGISLMTEAMSLAGMTETPVVFVDGMRPGPSTGLPTKHEHADIGHLVYGGHGDFPRIILAPGSAEECFHLAIKAFNLADRYQLPVFIAMDHGIAVSMQTTQGFQPADLVIQRDNMLTQEQLEDIDGYERYAFASSGVSPRSIPGQSGGIFLATGNEHWPDGHITEDPDNRTRMMEKRLRKMESARADLNDQLEFGNPEARVAVTGICSTKGPILEAMERLGDEGIPIKFMQIRDLWPFPQEDLLRFTETADRLIVVEHNATGQLSNLIRQEVGLHDTIHSLLKYDGTPFKPSEVYYGIRGAM